MSELILWVNGAFGSGKTQTSHELHRRIPNSYVFDPENAGFYIRRNVPKELRLGDFQDFPMWRSIAYEMLGYLDREYGGIVIVPMTVVDPSYFREIVGRLRADGADVRHFALCASKETLLRRLRSRGDGANSWPALQIDRCVEGLKNEAFRHHLDTEGLSVAGAAEAIAELAGIRLVPDNRGPLRKWTDRVRTQIGHIRWR